MPYWFNVPHVWRTNRKYFGFWSVLRVSLLTLACGIAIIVCAQAAVPLVQLPPLWTMLIALPAVYAYLLFMVAIHLVIPARVEVRRDRVLFNHGQTTVVVKDEEIVAIRITVFADDRIRLRVTYQRQLGHLRTRTAGVARKVNLERLSQLLPVSPEIRDARTAYSNYRRLVS